MRIALTHDISPAISSCALTFRKREPIDPDLAAAQHLAYCRALEECGIRVIQLRVSQHLPDSTFVEDVAVVVDELAVLASMGTESRRPEVENIAPVLSRYRPIERIEPPATLEGGDILQAGKTLFAGLSPRTNIQGIRALGRFLKPFGYRVIPVQCRQCLHLKSACTPLDDRTFLVNPAWIDTDPLSGYSLVPVPPEEPWAANVLRLTSSLLSHEEFEATNRMLLSMGYALKTCNISELLKAEAGMTCSSLIFESPGP